MDNRYFPHATDGSNNIRPSYTVTSTYNLVPNSAISLDSRSIITEWTEEALMTLKANEVYVGQLIFCQEDNTCRVCCWVPTKTINYTGANCLWEVVYTDSSVNWVDIKEYVPEKTVEEKIEDENAKLWRYLLNNSNGYWGFYNYRTTNPTEIKDMLLIEKFRNDILTNLIMGSTDNDVLSNSINKFVIREGEKTLAIPASKTDRAFSSANGCLFTAIIPTSSKLKIVKMQIEGSYQDENLQVMKRDLEYMDPVTLHFSTAEYKCFVMTVKPLDASKKHSTVLKVTFANND